MRCRLVFAALLCLAAAAAPACRQMEAAAAAAAGPAPAPRPPPREVRQGLVGVNGVCGLPPGKHLYWGDLHTHTAFSADAYSFRTRATPADAYAFARGDPLTIAEGAPTPGPIAQLPAGRPLDFNAVTDHSEWLTTAYACGADGGSVPFHDPADPLDPNPYFNTLTCQYYRNNFDFDDDPQPPLQHAFCTDGLPTSNNCIAETRSAWEAVQQAATAAYVPCSFTTFNAYEWSHMSQEGYTLHRNVIFAGTTVPDVPFDALSYPDPALLWDALDTGCNGGPCQALTIPHNSNLSGGRAFEIPGPGPGDPRVISQMLQYQRLAEVFQHKGSSECYYDGGSPVGLYNQDPSCQFEKVQKGGGPVISPYVPDSYVRTALANGLVRESNGLRNPLRLGLVGATDTHNATSGNVDEATWPGHGAITDRTALGRLNGPGATYNPGGITGVWAEENTREAIYQALYNRETFATSGPRIAVRFYQTADPTQFCVTGSFPDNILATNPVPMGGTFAGGAGTPYFVISATADVADLAEVDLIKLDVDSSGLRRSSVTRYHLNGTISGGMNLSRRAPCIWGSDPGLDPAKPAAYYARVLEVSTPRWSAYDCDKLDPGTVAECDNGQLRTTVQERAWTSPIWFEP